MTISRSEFLVQMQLDDVTLDVWIVEEWLRPQRLEDDFTFTDADLARARLIRDLQHDLGVNREGVGIILSLLDQVHGLRQALSRKVHQAER
jgi:chaperone modulatory protein CbpM